MFTKSSSASAVRKIVFIRVRRSILAAAIVPAGAMLALLPGSSALADAIFTPTDQILGGKENINTNKFEVGVVGTAAGVNNWPAGESPNHLIDGVAQKYLNFGITYTGFVVAPTFNGGNGSVATSMQLWTANDAPERDPSSYEIWGTNAALDFAATTFDLSQFTQVSAGSLTLPAGRGGTGAAALNSVNSQTVTFANTTGYKEYLIFFPTVKAGNANSMQVSEVQLFGIASFVNLTWSGNVSNVWGVNGVLNWKAAGNPSSYNDGNGATFDDTGSATRTSISVANGGLGVHPAAVLFQNSELKYTINGEPIVSPGTLTLNGMERVTLNNVNSYAAGTTVNAGTLVIGATGTLGSGALAVNAASSDVGNAVTVTFNSAQSIGSLSGNIVTPTTGLNTATINLTGDLTVVQSTDATYPGVIAGAGGLIKAGDAALTLTGINTYTGTTTVNAGILRSSAPGDNEQGALPAGKPVVVNAGATLLFATDDGAGYHGGSISSLTVNGGAVLGGAGTHSTLPDLVLNGGTLSAADAGNFFNGATVNYILDGNVTTVANATPSTIKAATILLRKDALNTGTSSPVTFNVPRGTGSSDLMISSVIQDAGAGLVKAGNGILSLLNANQYTGPTSITGGKVVIGNSSALGTGAVSLSTGSVLSMASAPGISGFSDFSLNGGASLDATGSVLGLTENVGNQARSAFSTAAFSVASGFQAKFVYTAGGNRAADGFTFTIQNSSPTAVGGGGGQLGYAGIASSAALEFNIYTGGGQPIGTQFTTAATGGYIASAPVNLASGNPIDVTIAYDPVAQTLTETLLDQATLATYTNVFPGVDYAGALGGTTGFVGFTGATGGATAAQTISNFAFDNFTRGVTLANNITIAGAAVAGIEVLPISATEPGQAELRGTVSLGAAATLNVTGGTTATDLPYRLSVTGPSTLAGNVTINVANNGDGLGSLVLGAITQTASAAVTKTGPGTLTIGGSATYTGTTAVAAGTLLVNGSISGAATTVASAARLGGIGTVTAVNVSAGGTLAPGPVNDIGTINTGPLSLKDSAIFRLELGAAAGDQVKVAGAGTLAGTIVLSLALVADPANGSTFTILDGTAPLIGYAGGARFSYLGAPLAEGQQFTVNSGGFIQPFIISYAADGGRDVTLFAVPEPGAGTSLLAGLGLMLGLRRRRVAASAGSR